MKDRNMSNRNAARDAAICAAYEQGSSVYDLGVQYNISHQRIRQILRAGNVQMRDERLVSEGLDEFLAINVTDDEKEELRRLAEDQGTSMARLSRDWIRERLADIRLRREQVAP